MGDEQQQLPQMEVGLHGVGLGGRTRGEHARDEQQRIAGQDGGEQDARLDEDDDQ